MEGQLACGFHKDPTCLCRLCTPNCVSLCPLGLLRLLGFPCLSFRRLVIKINRKYQNVIFPSPKSPYNLSSPLKKKNTEFILSRNFNPERKKTKQIEHITRDHICPRGQLVQHQTASHLQLKNGACNSYKQMAHSENIKVSVITSSRAQI